jgi:transcriptional regulator with XRE-family HTH domain
LAPLFSVLLGLSQEVSPHGFDHKTILTRLEESGFQPSLADLDRIVELTTPDLFKVNLEDVAPNWMSWLYEVLLEKVHGTIRMVRDTLVVTHRDDTHINLLANCTTLVLDATQTRSRLALEMSVEAEDVWIISQDEIECENLFVHVLRGAGTPVKGRRTDYVYEVRKAIEAIHGKTSVLDKKGMGDKTNEDDVRGVQFRDNRGSNAFKGDNSLLSVGLQCTNMGAAADMYSILTGEIVSADEEHTGFRQYLRELNAAEEIQSVGRLRANRRLDETLHYYLWADSSHTPIEEIMAAHPGATLVEDQMIDIYSRAANKMDRLKLQMIGVVQRLPGITQKELADLTESSVSSVSRLCSNFGGYKKTCQMLLDLSIAFDKLKNSDKIDWDAILPTGLAEHTSMVINDDSAPHETALELEKIIEPLSQDQMGALLTAIGKTKATELVYHLYYLQSHRDRDADMKLSEAGDSVEDLAEGLTYIIQFGDTAGLEDLRVKFEDDKTAMTKAASLLNDSQRKILKEMVVIGNKAREYRKGLEG